MLNQVLPTMMMRILSMGINHIFAGQNLVSAWYDQAWCGFTTNEFLKTAEAIYILFYLRTTSINSTVNKNVQVQDYINSSIHATHLLSTFCIPTLCWVLGTQWQTQWTRAQLPGRGNRYFISSI